MPSSISPWLSEPLETTAALVGDVGADVAVVGAGLAGLNAALALHADGLRCVVLEARTAGFGASGRNAGHLTPTIGKDLPTLTRLFGRERVRGLVRLADLAIQHVESLIGELQIACDYEPVGNVIAAVHPRQHANLDRAAAAAREYGVPGELLEPAEMRRRGLPARFTRGYLEPHGGILQPGRYVRGLRQAVLDRGIALYESTPVQRIDDGALATLYTPGGRARARNVVLATNAYTPRLGRLRSTMLPVYVQLFRTAPLSDAQLAAIGWQGREGIYTAHEMLESYRLTAENRIVGGAKWIRYGWNGRELPDADPALGTALEGVFRSRFPELRDLAVTDHWGGPIGFAIDFLPLVDRGGRHGNILHAVAFAGHGVALASYAGRLVADLLLGRDSPGAALWTRRRIPLPPEPFRWLIVRALTGIFGAIDQRAEPAR
jgi:gamma-glutamylputrescine oxidase